MERSKMDNQEAIKIVQKCIWDWKCGHDGELNDVLKYLKPKNKEAYKIVIEIAQVEDQLIEQAMMQFQPLLEQLKETLIQAE